MQAIYLPGADIHNQFYDLLLTPNPAEYERNYLFDITPVTDNRPFFFYTVQPRDLWNFVRTASHDTADYKVEQGRAAAVRPDGGEPGGHALILLLPPLVLGTRLPRHPRRAAASCCISCSSAPATS